MSWFSSSIRAKGLVIVFVPLAFAIILIVGLRLMLESARRESAVYERSRAVVEASNAISKDAFEVGSSLYVFSISRDASLEKRFDSNLKVLQEDAARLKQLVAGDKQETEVVSNMERLMTRAIALLEETRNSVNDRQRLSDISELGETRLELQSIMRKLTTYSSELAKIEQSRLPQKQFDETKFRTAFDAVLIGGLIVNVVIALALLRYFTLGITRRVEVLADNTRKLARKEPLATAIGGNDEIAVLDNSFHQMAGELKEAERLKQAFIAMVSHELRSPLQVILVTLRMLTSGHHGSLNESGTKSVAAASDGAERLIGLVNEILDVEKLESGELAVVIEPCDLFDIVERSAGIFASQSEQQSVALKVSCPPSVPLEADPARLEQVIVNLLSNAFKYSPRGSSISIEVVDNEETVTLSVIDEGPGIKPENLELVFERFYQVADSDAESKTGSGLGLAICKSIITAHGGTISVTSEFGNGSTFSFTLKREF